MFQEMIITHALQNVVYMLDECRAFRATFFAVLIRNLYMRTYTKISLLGIASALFPDSFFR